MSVTRGHAVGSASDVSGLGGFDAVDGRHSVDGLVERGDRADAGRLGAGDEVGLGEVELVRL